MWANGEDRLWLHCLCRRDTRRGCVAPFSDTQGYRAMPTAVICRTVANQAKWTGHGVQSQSAAVGLMASSRASTMPNPGRNGHFYSGLHIGCAGTAVVCVSWYRQQQQQQQVAIYIGGPWCFISVVTDQYNLLSLYVGYLPLTAVPERRPYDYEQR